MKKIAIALILLTLLLLLSLTREMVFRLIMTFVKPDAYEISMTQGSEKALNCPPCRHNRPSTGFIDHLL